MLKYLKSAFLVRQRIPLLGAVPINLMLLAIIALMGLVHPAFWLLGAAAEVALLWALVGNARFRKLVDASAVEVEAEQQPIQLELNPAAQSQLAALQEVLLRIETDYAKFSPSDPTARENMRNLRELEQCYLQLLQARQHLDADRKLETVKLQLAELDQALANPALAPALRTSKQATRDLLERRLAAIDQRQATRSEIESDLARIEAQVHLAADAASVHAKPATLSFDLDFASRMIAHPELYDGPRPSE